MLKKVWWQISSFQKRHFTKEDKGRRCIFGAFFFSLPGLFMSITQKIWPVTKLEILWIMVGITSAFSRLHPLLVTTEKAGTRQHLRVNGTPQRILIINSKLWAPPLKNYPFLCTLLTLYFKSGGLFILFIILCNLKTGSLLCSLDGLEIAT